MSNKICKYCKLKLNIDNYEEYRIKHKGIYKYFHKNICKNCDIIVSTENKKHKICINCKLNLDINKFDSYDRNKNGKIIICYVNKCNICNNIKNKQCKMCGDSNINNFRAKIHNKRKYIMSICRKCENVNSIKYKSEHKEEIFKQRKIYQIKNKEFTAYKRKEYRKNNKVKTSEIDKNFRIKYKNKIDKRNKIKKDNRKILREQNEIIREKSRAAPKCKICGNVDINNFYSKCYDGKQYFHKTCKKCLQINNKEKINLKSRNKRKINPIFRLRGYVSGRIGKLLKQQGYYKNNSIMKYLNYSIKELKIYIESLFEPWMNWDNQGPYVLSMWNDNDKSTWKWQLDHIIPCSDLPFISMEDENFKKCWALENLRPLSAKDNVLDGVRRTRHCKKI